jgi:hypothetical protein
MDICKSFDVRFLPASAYVAKKRALRAREQLKDGRLVAFLTTENDPKQAIHVVTSLPPNACYEFPTALCML